MRIELRRVVWCLSQARAISEQYERYVLPTFPRSVDDFYWVCQQHVAPEKTIEMHEIPILAAGRSIKGVFVATDTGYQIYLLAGLSEEESRFVRCKELFHVLLDLPDESRNMDLYGHLDEVVSAFPQADSEPGCAVAWELLAEAAAMEFLFPLSEREAAINAANGSFDPAQVAARYHLPRSVVEGYCTESSMEFFRRCHAEL